MTKHVAVFFTKTNARILVNPNPDALKGAKNVVWNPDRSRVQGIPPHFWKLKHGKIYPMNRFERAKRKRDIKKHGVVNTPDYEEKKTNYLYYILGLLAASGAGYGIYYYLTIGF
jgi:hypothetical protein